MLVNDDIDKELGELPGPVVRSRQNKRSHQGEPVAETITGKENDTKADLLSGTTITKSTKVMTLGSVCIQCCSMYNEQYLQSTSPQSSCIDLIPRCIYYISLLHVKLLITLGKPYAITRCTIVFRSDWISYV